VIALGGGALREINFIETVKRSGYVIWLWSDIINLIKRTNDGKRPLLKNDDPGKTLSELLKKRFGDYSRTSDIIIDTDNRTTEETARKIYNETNKII
jgi:shikimate kinase